ncbi:uncharacterized protein LOC127701622 [Mytilus californianus]|uniref:uncharacterized protein LOC127701622 n=1 Tax=Mytilus californianus TaxID=6549 RepID=UPI0022467CF5|nr:uncharacterized protein LOC127701622 [Mytilus californianus]
MQHIQKLETESQNFVTNIIHTLSSKYSFVLPQEFHLQYEFSEKLPDCKITKYQENLKQIKSETVAKTEKGEHQCISSDKVISDEATFAYIFTRQTYLHPRDLNIKTCSGFSAVPKGMIVKQKIATASTGVIFGWYKMQPWQQKKWAFFMKNSNTTLS